ncbi:MAG: ferric reductase-like transmembrane domain-containing protein [Cyclobacteriaceae bacterium]|nr:ferric reductase-like transmembrane domain-containing protein [Cyclobacteriaceae bacterium HetDA_MAG_MS6]
MSVSYRSILWNKQKIRYDKGLVLFILIFLVAFFGIHLVFHSNVTIETIIIRAFGLLSLVLLHVILTIGPLTRINPRFLIVLYNRRHLGVTMFLMALIHGAFSMMNFHGLGDINPIRSIFLSNLQYQSVAHFPFQVLGFFALLILGLMAVTSHDFWLKNLGYKTWKALHMMVYIAYGLVILHVVMGVIQNETSIVLFAVILTAFFGIAMLHLLVAVRETTTDQQSKLNAEWVLVGAPEEIKESRAKIVAVSGERVAIFLYQGMLSAVNNVCRHQGGPLGEGKIIDGCITCPWHGYQYLPGNGQSPPPFTEKVETYDLKLENGQVWVNAQPHPEGTAVEPLKIS